MSACTRAKNRKPITHTHTPTARAQLCLSKDPPPGSSACRLQALWLFQSVKEKNLMIVDICWSSPCELSWSLACGNHHLTLCTHKRSWRVGCHGNSGSFGYGCVSWRQHMLNFLLCPISALQIFPLLHFSFSQLTGDKTYTDFSNNPFFAFGYTPSTMIIFDFLLNISGRQLNVCN